MTSGCAGGWGDLSEAPESIISRLNLTPWMLASEASSSNSSRSDFAAGCLSRFFGLITTRGLRNERCSCLRSRWK